MSHMTDLRRRTMPCAEHATIPAPAPDAVQQRIVQQRTKALLEAREHLAAAVARVGALSTVKALSDVLAMESLRADRCWIATLADSVRVAGEVADRAQRRRDARFGLGRDG